MDVVQIPWIPMSYMIFQVLHDVHVRKIKQNLLESHVRIRSPDSPHCQTTPWEECLIPHQVNIVSLNSVALALANEAQWQRAMTLLQPWWPWATVRRERLSDRGWKKAKVQVY